MITAKEYAHYRDRSMAPISDENHTRIDIFCKSLRENELIWVLTADWNRSNAKAAKFKKLIQNRVLVEFEDGTEASHYCYTILRRLTATEIREELELLFAKQRFYERFYVSN